ncbi:MAG: response regulator [Gemmatimonadaceae bacterium]|nr:response regulator [Gemmatimonadaceae bacterium]
MVSKDDEGPVSGAEQRLGVPAPRPTVVLIVDDDASVLFASRRILVRYGYTVLEAPGGEEALQIVREHGSKIEVVLTDMRMPGMDGQALARRLVTLLPDVRIVFMSGYTDGLQEKESLAPGRAFLAKPFTLEQLTETIVRVLA